MQTVKYLLITLVLFAFINICPGQEWTRFRGPNGSGISQATTVPTKWTEADYNWKVDLPGEGHSSPVIWEKKIFLTCADPKTFTRKLLCLSTEDGSILWQKSHPFQKYKIHKVNTYATNTLAVDQLHVYALWQTLEESSITAYTHQGDQVWRIELGQYKSGHGTGSSPIVYQDKLILANDHDGKQSFLLALDKTNGKKLWQVSRISDRACYSTPCVFELPGRKPEIIFTHSFRGITGIDAESGKINWEIDVFGTHQQRAVASPVIYQDMVIGSSGFTTAEKNVVFVKPIGSGQASEVKEEFRLFKSVPHVPTPLVLEDRLVLLTDTGILNVHSADTGEKLFHKRIGGNFFSSPIAINGFLYCVDVDGLVSVISIEDEVKIISQHDLKDECRSTPAVSAGVLYLRTRNSLFSIGGS